VHQVGFYYTDVSRCTVNKTYNLISYYRLSMCFCLLFMYLWYISVLSLYLALWLLCQDSNNKELNYYYYYYYYYYYCHHHHNLHYIISYILPRLKPKVLIRYLLILCSAKISASQRSVAMHHVRT